MSGVSFTCLLRRSSMAFNCFFGAELTPLEAKRVPIPERTSLVITSVCVATSNTYNGRMTLSVQSLDGKHRFAVATLHPAAGVFHFTTQQVFGTEPVFHLEVDRTDACKSQKHAPVDAKGAAAPQGTELLTRCCVHATGYYEMHDDDEDSEDGDVEYDDDGDE